MATRDPQLSDDWHLVHDRWRTWLPLAGVILALLVLVALPLLRVVQVRPLYEEMRTVTEPSRSLLSRVHVALALEQSLLRDFVEGEDSVAAARYLKVVEDERAAYRDFAPLARELGEEVTNEFEQHLELERAWHGEIRALLDRPATERRKRDPLHAERYEELLLSAARLNASINSVAAARRAAIEATTRSQAWISFAIGIVALAAVLTVGWLGRRLRSFAVQEELARRRLEQVIESRSRLLRGITHDLKNPLHAISANAEVLDEGIKGPLSDDQQRIVRRIRSSAQHMVAMVRDLLDSSISEGGPLIIRPGQCSIRHVIRDVVDDYSGAAARRQLELTSESGDDPLDVVTDQSRVRQILENLVSNAVKYTDPGGTIKIAAYSTSTDNESVARDMIVVEVADTGSGIPPDKIEKIFEEFWRLDAHRNIAGSGLGLAVARRIATLLGGTLTVQSSASGSTFSLWIPRDRRHQSTRPITDGMHSPAGWAEPAGDGI
jgi:signal transduction histidine kinase